MSNAILKKKLEKLGYKTKGTDLVSVVIAKATELAGIKSPVLDEDLNIFAQEHLLSKKGDEITLIQVEKADYHCVDNEHSATVVLSQNGNKFQASGKGNGPIASVWAAIIKAVSEQGIFPEKLTLKDFDIKGAPGGVEAKGLVTICVENNGKRGYARGFETDIVLAFAKALVSAINHLLYVPVECVQSAGAGESPS